MQRRTFISALSAAGLAGRLPAATQQPGKLPRIGYLAFDRTRGNPQVREAFLGGLRDLGYVEGRNLVVEYRDAEGKPERLAALAAELAALKVDVIWAGGRLARRARGPARDGDHPDRVPDCRRSGCRRAGRQPGA